MSAKLATVNSDNSKENEFCTWFRGVLDMLDEPFIDESRFSKIIAKMNETTNNTISVSPINTTNLFEDFASIPKPSAEDMESIFDSKTGYPKANLRC